MNTKADFLRINYGNEEFEDMPISEEWKGYTRVNNTIRYYKQLDNGTNELHCINLNECDYVEIWENGICTGIEERIGE